MADVSVYRRCIATYGTSTGNGNAIYRQGELRAATDAVVTANPANWAAITDADMQDATWRLTKSK